MKKLLFVALLPLFFACKDEPEQIPAYLDLQPFEVTSPGGNPWHKVTDGWLYVNGEFLGAYTLPDTVPVLAEGESEVLLFPGVKENGIVATPNIYPYLIKFEKKYDLKGAQIMKIQPLTAYDSKAVFAFGPGRGDFDGGSNIGLENRDKDDALNVKITSEGAFAGQCLLMQIDTAHPVMDIATERMKDLPITGAPEVWLEMHYKNDVPFFLYMLGGATEFSQRVFQFNLSENWNKIYINLTEAITTSAQSEQRLFFRLSLPKNDAGKYTQDAGNVWIDNIRVLHY